MVKILSILAITMKIIFSEGFQNAYSFSYVSVQSITRFEAFWDLCCEIFIPGLFLTYIA